MKQVRIVFLMLLCATASLGPVDAAAREPLKVTLWLGGFAHEFRNVGGILSEALPQQCRMKISIAWDEGFLDSAERPDVILMYHCHSSTEGKNATDSNTDGKTAPVKRNHDWEKAAIDAFRLPEGFEISLVAAEPHLANPISMTLDEQGRMSSERKVLIRDATTAWNPFDSMATAVVSRRINMP